MNRARPSKNGPTRQRGLGCSIATVVLLLLVVAAVIVSMPFLLTLLANASASSPLVTAGAAQSRRIDHERAAANHLDSYGWIDKNAGVVHVPIERAISLLTTGDLPVGAAGLADANSNSEAGTARGAADESVNFNDHILPLFEQYCVECHGDDNPEEGLVLNSYQGVMAGSFYGSVIKPNDPAGSYLLELVETGQMPKRGDDLSPSEIDTIIAWINAGAPEEGSATNSETNATAVTPETVSFASDVLPLFVEYCAECHGDDNPEEGLVLTSHKDVMLGSFYGSVIKPNDPAGSYLLELVETGQMPKRGDDLSPSEIDTIIAWINAGAPDN